MVIIHLIIIHDEPRSPTRHPNQQGFLVFSWREPATVIIRWRVGCLGTTQREEESGAGETSKRTVSETGKTLLLGETSGTPLAEHRCSYHPPARSPKFGDRAIDT
jgi:hypothetical protein